MYDAWYTNLNCNNKTEITKLMYKVWATMLCCLNYVIKNFFYLAKWHFFGLFWSILLVLCLHSGFLKYNFKYNVNVTIINCVIKKWLNIFCAITSRVNLENKKLWTLKHATLLHLNQKQKSEKAVKIETVSKMFLPSLFLIFNLIYWVYLMHFH